MNDWYSLKRDGTTVMARAGTASLIVGSISSVVGYYSGGRKMGALYGYSMLFGSLIPASLAFGGAVALRKHRGVDDWQNHAASWGATAFMGRIVLPGVRKSLLLCASSGMVFAAGGALYKLSGDAAWDASRKQWISFRVHHNLPKDDSSVRQVFHWLDPKEKKELWDFTFGVWSKLIKDGKFPEPTYGPVVRERERLMKEKAEKEKLELEKKKEEETKRWW
jgi:hypothetical protein